MEIQYKEHHLQTYMQLRILLKKENTILFIKL